MRDFIYNIPTKVYFGKNQLHHLGEELKRFGKRVLLTYGGGSIKRTGLYDRVVNEINKAGLELYELSGIEPNPRVSSVNAGATLCKEHDIDVILAVGGGSVIDASKFMAAGRFYDGDCWDFHGKKVPIEKALPLVTVLTISATGSEMDTGGVITNPETHQKLGRAADILRPAVSFLDPTNTYTVSRYQTACGSADILSHIMETYFSREKGMYLTDTAMVGLMKTVIKFAPIACEEPENYEARSNLMWASSWAINDFIRMDKGKNPWICHPIEHELSAFYDITHGLGLAIVTPRWMKKVLSEETLDRFVEFGIEVWEIDYNLSKREIALEAIRCLEDFFYKDLGLTDNLTALNITDEYFDIMAERVSNYSGEPRYTDLSKQDVLDILKACL